MIPEQELITSEKWKRYQKNPYVRDFETTISILEGSIINSTDDLFKIWCCGGHLTREWDWHQYCPSEPCDVEQFSTDLIMQKPKIAISPCFLI